MESTNRTNQADHAQLMDRVYRVQRHFYDATRRFYLLGRDRLLAAMPLRDGDHVLEVGCGTARNLVKLARRRPDARLYGLDASAAMLETATAKVRRLGLEQRIVLRGAMAEEWTPAAAFGLDRPFDAIFFSYALSMIPPWQAAVDNALRHVTAGGAIYIVDFWDQAEWPGWARTLNRWWLSRFHVRHEPALLQYLRDRAEGGDVRLELTGLYRRFAYLARISPMQ